MELSFHIFAKMNTAYLILGCNKGDKLNNLKHAFKLIGEKAGTIKKESDIFVTAAWGNTEQPDFYNQALCLQTFLSAEDLLKTLLSIEQILGRVRDEKKWMERTMDIDILFFNNAIINTADLIIPHPFIQERNFVLVPMAQLEPRLIHPVLRKSIQTLLSECPDKLKITKLETTNG